MRINLIISLFIANILFAQQIKGRYKLLNIDSTKNFYILKFTSSKPDSLNCFLLTSSKLESYKEGKKLKLKKKYFLELKNLSYEILEGLDNIDSWGVDDKTIWNKGDKCWIYSSKNIEGLLYKKK
ncbi:hypothetical protein [Chryseobacterium sp. JK1]|uniref:hypothetical protein n=1 Tax=Chryseobacterium sp. JK1 TaxID=874294 RepID=UPI003D681367